MPRSEDLLHHEKILEQMLEILTTETCGRWTTCKTKPSRQ